MYNSKSDFVIFKFLESWEHVLLEKKSLIGSPTGGEGGQNLSRKGLKWSKNAQNKKKCVIWSQILNFGPFLPILDPPNFFFLKVHEQTKILIYNIWKLDKN